VRERAESQLDRGVTLSGAKGAVLGHAPFASLRVTRVVARLAAASVLAVCVLASCMSRLDRSTTLHLATTPAGPDTRVTLSAEPGFKLNAHLAPALELADGAILRFDAAQRTADSAYFAVPPSALLRGRHDRVHGTLRVSVCRDGEQVCRSITLEL